MKSDNRCRFLGTTAYIGRAYGTREMALALAATRSDVPTALGNYHLVLATLCFTHAELVQEGNGRFNSFILHDLLRKIK